MKPRQLRVYLELVQGSKDLVRDLSLRADDEASQKMLFQLAMACKYWKPKGPSLAAILCGVEEEHSEDYERMRRESDERGEDIEC